MGDAYQKEGEIMDKSIDAIVDEFVEAIQGSSIYKEYVRQQNIVKNQQDVIDKINEIRSLNMRLQSIHNSEQAYDEQDRLEKRFDELSEDKRVYDFVEAENRFIGMYQEIYRRIMENIQFI